MNIALASRYVWIIALINKNWVTFILKMKIMNRLALLQTLIFFRNSSTFRRIGDILGRSLRPWTLLLCKVWLNSSKKTTINCEETARPILPKNSSAVIPIQMFWTFFTNIKIELGVFSSIFWSKLTYGINKRSINARFIIF